MAIERQPWARLGSISFKRFTGDYCCSGGYTNHDAFTIREGLRQPGGIPFDSNGGLAHRLCWFGSILRSP